MLFYNNLLNNYFDFNNQLYLNGVVQQAQLVYDVVMFQGLFRLNILVCLFLICEGIYKLNF